jgi:hypothetical protein
VQARMLRHSSSSLSPRSSSDEAPPGRTIP